MSNVKRIAVEGSVPFNYYEFANLAQRFAFMQSPTSGLRVEFGQRETYVPNDRGGRTAMYEFTISGQEAVAWTWVEALVEQIEACGGTVTRARGEDVEAGGHSPVVKIR